MFHKTINNLDLVKKEIQSKISNLNYLNYNPEIIAICKTFPISDVLPLINYGHVHFGENKVQESIEKWTDIKNDFKNIKLHMVGKLQTNKVKHVLQLFDYIHSLDNIKLAEKISNEQQKIGKKIKIFIQVNIGNESQKSGIIEENLFSFYRKCQNDFGLQIEGLMCIPPNDNNSEIYFSKMRQLSDQINLPELSMGMSDDYLKACEYKTTFFRIGSKIFGKRN
jgi:pyridoxal phosphate enzyme (YggS family)